MSIIFGNVQGVVSRTVQSQIIFIKQKHRFQNNVHQSLSLRGSDERRRRSNLLCFLKVGDRLAHNDNRIVLLFRKRFTSVWTTKMQR